MADYYSPEQLSKKLGLSLEELEEARKLELLSPTYKKGLIFYSAQQAYRLEALSKLRRRGLTWEKAARELSKQPLYELSKT